MVLVAPLSPYGFGGTVGAEGRLGLRRRCEHRGRRRPTPSSSAGWPRRTPSEGEPSSSPRLVLRGFFGPEDNADAVDEDFLVDELLTTRTGEDFYPGDARASENWPTVAPGGRGILNTMAPTVFRVAEGLVALEPKPPVTWVHGTADQIVSYTSLFDLANAGREPGVPCRGGRAPTSCRRSRWSGQMRAALARYAAAGGTTREVPL